MALTVDSPLAVRRSSDLSKHSAEVFAEAENHPVTVTRRDGESLVLMSQREADARNELLNIAATSSRCPLRMAHSLTGWPADTRGCMH